MVMSMKRNLKKEPQGNSGAEKYNDCDRRCVRGVAERPEPGGEGTGEEKRPDRRVWRQDGNWDHKSWGTERKKNDEKGSESKGLEEPYKANQYTHSGTPGRRRERKWQRNTQKNNAENFRNFMKDAIL